MEFWQVKCTNTDMGTQQILYSHVVLPYTEEYRIGKLSKCKQIHVHTVQV